MFDSLKQKFADFVGVFAPPQQKKRPAAVDLSDKLSRNGGNGFTSHSEDPYSFDYKRPRKDGLYTDDEKLGPLSGGFVRSRGVPFTKSVSDSRNMWKTSYEAHKTGGDTKGVRPTTIPDVKRFVPLGRFGSSSTSSNAPASFDVSRRLVEEVPSEEGITLRNRLPSNNTFSHAAGTVSNRLVNALNDRQCGVTTADHAPLGGISVSSLPVGGHVTRSKASQPSAHLNFDSFKNNQHTALEGWAKARPQTSSNFGLGTSRPVLVSERMSGRVSASVQRPTDSLFRQPLESSYSKKLRESIRRPSTQQPSPTVGEVITIDDSDEENAVSATRNCRVIPFHYKSPTELGTNRTRLDQLSTRKTEQSPSRDEDVIVIGARSAAEAYDVKYRDPNYVPEKRQNEILGQLSQRIKAFTPSDLDFIPLNSEQEEKVNDALAPGPGDQILSDAFKITIRRKDMVTLKGLSWLNDEVANFFLEMIVDRSSRDPSMPKVYTFNTFFYTQLLNKGYQSLKRWTRRVDVFAYDMILVPVHLSSHWCLAVIDFKEKKMKFFDSLGHENRQCFHLLRTYLEEESKDKNRTDVRLDWETEWTFSFVASDESIPQQQNMCDCGVFMLKFADFVSRKKAINFSQDNMPYFRKRICWEILQKKLLDS